MIRITAGPMITINNAGKIPNISGKSSFTGVLAACSRASRRRTDAHLAWPGSGVRRRPRCRGQSAWSRARTNPESSRAAVALLEAHERLPSARDRAASPGEDGRTLPRGDRRDRSPPSRHRAFERDAGLDRDRPEGRGHPGGTADSSDRCVAWRSRWVSGPNQPIPPSTMARPRPVVGLPSATQRPRARPTTRRRSSWPATARHSTHCHCGQRACSAVDGHRREAMTDGGQPGDSLGVLAPRHTWGRNDAQLGEKVGARSTPVGTARWRGRGQAWRRRGQEGRGAES